MPNSDPWDRFVHPYLTFMSDSYILLGQYGLNINILLQQIQQKRKDLKVIVASATLDAEVITSFLLHMLLN